MSIIDCVKGKGLPKRIEAELQEEYDTLLARNNGDQGLAAAELAESFAKRSATQKTARIKGALAADRVDKEIQAIMADDSAIFNNYSKPAQMMAKALGHEPSHKNAVSKLYSRAAMSGQREVIDALSNLEEFHAKVAAKGIRFRHNTELMGKITDGLIDGVDEIADPEVRSLAREIKGVWDLLVKSYQQQGGIMGEMENYFPLKHNRQKIADAGFDTWFTAWKDMNDLEKMVDFKTGKPMTPERFEAVSRDVFANIVSDGAYHRAIDMETGNIRSRRPGDLFARRMQGRMSRPKSGKAYKDYNEAFGTGEESEYDLMLANMREMAHDTGLMKVLGPTPENLNAQMGTQALARGEGPKAQKRIDALFRTMIGHWDGSSDSMFAKAVTGGQHLMDAALLGSASVAAIGDGIFVAQTMRMAGLTGQGGAAVDGFLKGIAGNPDDITRAIHTTEAFMHTQVSRYMDGVTPTVGGRVRTGLNDAKNLNHRLSGLQNVTMGTGDSMSMAFASGMGEMVGKKVAYDALPADFRKLLGDNAIREQDWKRLLANGTDERGMITRNGLPDDMADIADKVGNTELQLRMWATNSPELATRVYSTGNVFGSRMRGDAGHLLMSSAMQFKSFPLQVYRNHLVPAMIKAADGELGQLGQLTLSGIVMGTMIVQLKELLKGRETVPFDDPSLYMKGLWQSGVGGVWGDVFFKDPDAYKRNIISELAGPLAGMTNEKSLLALSTIKAAFTEDEEVDGRAWVRAGRSVVPFGTLWYGKLAFERTIIDGLDATVDDGYYDYVDQKNKKLKEERGGEGWMPQGSLYE